MRGAVVAPDNRSSVRRNLFTNPCAGTNTSGYYMYIPGSTGTIERRTDGGRFTNTYVRMTCNGNATGSQGGIYLVRTGDLSSRILVQAGKSYMLSGFMRTAIARELYLRIEWKDSTIGGVTVGTATTNFLHVSNTSDWVPFRITATAPSGTVGATGCFYISSNSTFSSGDQLDVSNVIFEEVPTNSPSHFGAYFDGASPNARWEGASHNSFSIELADTSSKNLIADSSFNFAYKPNLGNDNHYNISTYWSSPWRTIYDGTKGRCIEFVTNDDTKPQGIIVFPFIANSSRYTARPLSNEGEQYTVSVDVLAPAGCQFVLGFRRVNASTSISQDGQGTSAGMIGTGDWQRYSYTATVNAANAGFYFGMQLRVSESPIPPIGTTLRIANVQVEKSPVATAFEATRPDW